MARSIFFLDENEQVVQLKEEKYESEDLFQRLIEKLPDILAGDQITPEQPRRWIFISREMGVPEREGGSDQWFLDHLFIDQDAIPTFVEVKRSSDTRIRREVVAQMLDYAANASAYWPVKQLRAAYEQRCVDNQTEPLEELGLSRVDADVYWEKVHTNLRLGKLRLLFVADEIPQSLQRIIEFLNGQMTDTEVLGLEIRQFVSEKKHRTLVPRIIGQTAAAVQVKSGEGVVWNQERFLERVRTNDGMVAAEVCRKLLEAFSELGCRIWWGKGQVQVGFIPVYDGKQGHQLCSVYSYNQKTRIEIYFQHFKAPFHTQEKQEEMIERLNQIPGVRISKEKVFKRPSFECGVLEKPERFEQFMMIYREMLRQIRQAE